MSNSGRTKRASLLQFSTADKPRGCFWFPILTGTPRWTCQLESCAPEKNRSKPLLSHAQPLAFFPRLLPTSQPNRDRPSEPNGFRTKAFKRPDLIGQHGKKKGPPRRGIRSA